MVTEEDVPYSVGVEDEYAVILSVLKPFENVAVELNAAGAVTVKLLVTVKSPTDNVVYVSEPSVIVKVSVVNPPVTVSPESKVAAP